MIDTTNGLPNVFALDLDETLELMTNMPSFCQVSGVPESLQELRARWASLYRSAFCDYIREISHWAASEDEAGEYVDRQIAAAEDRFSSDNLDDWFEEIYHAITPAHMQVGG